MADREDDGVPDPIPRGLSEEEIRSWREVADNLEPCLALGVDGHVNWRTSPPMGYIWANYLDLTRVPRDWERIVREHWPKQTRKNFTPARAIGCLRLEIEEGYAPVFAEAEWNRRHAPFKSQWLRYRSRIMTILLQMACRRRE